MRTYYPRMRAVLQVLFEDFADFGDGIKAVSNSQRPLVHTYEVVPQSMKIEANAAREADTFELELDYSDFPFDPRTVRSCLVSLHLADVRHPQQQLAGGSRDTLRFIGFLDEPESALSEKGDTVTLAGRDYTGLYLDKPWVTAIRVDRPFSHVVADIINGVPGAEHPTDMPAAIAVQKLSDRLGKTKYSPSQGDDAWTVLTELSQLLGVIPVFDLDTLRFRDATSFGGGEAVFLYGENIKSLRFRKKLNEARTRQVKVVCWDEAARESREATYPTEPIVLRRKVSTQGKVTTEAAPLITFTVAGGFTPDELSELARDIYEREARQQVEGEIETCEMVDLTEGMDLTRLANGDAVFLKLGRVSPSDLAQMTVREAVRELTRGPNPMNRDAAYALARAFQSARRLSTRFYVQSATHRMSREDGYALSVRFINFVGPGG